MELKIGVIHTGREIELELGEDGPDVVAQAEKALQDGARLLWFTDTKGKRVGVVADKLAYLQLEGAEAQRVVGFSA
jgi:hypothetical protein